MEKIVKSLGILQQALLEQSKQELQKAEEHLKQYETELAKIDTEIENNYTEMLAKKQMDLQIKVELTKETIATYKSFIE